MEKTKLGITIKLFGAAMYFIGLVSLFPLVLAAGYVLLFEENQWLKRVAIKAVAVVLFFAILSGLLGVATDSTSFIHNVFGLFDNTINLLTLNRIISLIRVAPSIAQSAILLLLGFRALNMRDMSVGPVDGVITKNM